MNHSKPILRDYQEEAILAVLKAWAAGVRRPALQLATGLGKTVILAELIRIMVEAPGRSWRPVVLVHRDELVKQTVRKLHDAAPWMKVGVLKAERSETVGTDVVVASVQTIARRLDKIDLTRFNLVIVDEAHHSPARIYRETREHFGCFKTGGNTLSLGVSATLQRTDKIGLGDDWDCVVYDRDVAWGVEQQFLVEPEARKIVLPGLDMRNVKLTRTIVDGVSVRDYDPKALGKAMAQPEAAALIVAEYIRHGRNEAGELRRGIMFCPLVDTAIRMAEEFRSAQVPVEVITGKTTDAERAASYDRVRTGESKLLISVMVLTEGFDLPEVEVCIMARPTQSVPLYIQCVGRVLRPSPWTGKTGALILDVCGTTALGLVSVSDLSLPDLCRCETGCGPQCSPDAERPCRCGNGTVCGPDCYCKPAPTEPEEDEIEPGQRLPAMFDIPDAVESITVDPFTGRRTDIKKRSPWLLSKSGWPFLPSTMHFEFVIFLKREPDGTWVVGEKPKSGAAKRLEEGMTFEDARRAALDSYPYPTGAPALTGDISAAQIAALWRLGIEPPTPCTKQSASDRLNVEYVSRWL